MPGAQQFLDPILHQRMRLAAADLHQHPRPRRAAADFLDQAAGQGRVAIFVQVLHPPSLPSSSSSAPISSQQAVGPLRLFGIHAADGESDVNDDVIAALSFRHEIETGLPRDAAETDGAEAEPVNLVRFHDLSRYRQTHTLFPSYPICPILLAYTYGEKRVGHRFCRPHPLRPATCSYPPDCRIVFVLRRKFRISGIVQGVGFRPWVYQLAQRHGLGG